MNTFLLLFRDELNGFYKSGVMIALWVFLPLFGIVFYYLLGGDPVPMGGPGGAGALKLPASTIISLYVSNIGAQITALMLTVAIINEKQKHVYDIFVIRPIRRSHILLAKFFSVFICVGLACVLAILAGALLDLINGHPNASRLLMDQLESLVMGLGIVATFSAVGIFFGVLADSIIVGVILILFAGGFVTFLPALPPLLGLPNSALWSLLLGAATTAVVLALASLAFNKKQF